MPVRLIFAAKKQGTGALIEVDSSRPKSSYLMLTVSPRMYPTRAEFRVCG